MSCATLAVLPHADYDPLAIALLALVAAVLLGEWLVVRRARREWEKRRGK